MEGEKQQLTEAYYMSVFGALPKGFKKMEGEEKAPVERHYHSLSEEYYISEEYYMSMFGCLPEWFNKTEDKDFPHTPIASLFIKKYIMPTNAGKTVVKRKSEASTSSQPSPKRLRLSEQDQAVLDEEIIFPTKKEWHINIKGILAQYNPRMARAIVSTKATSSNQKENEPSRISRAKENIHREKVLDFCERIKAQYIHLNRIVVNLGYTNVGHKTTLVHCKLIERVLNHTYEPSEDLVRQKLMIYNPKMARSYLETANRSSKTNNDAVRRSRARKAVLKDQLKEAGSVIKKHVEKLKVAIKEMTSI